MARLSSSRKGNMRVWNVGGKNISQLYNNLNYIIGANEIKVLGDDVAVFFLSKKEIRGQGLVQFKEDDDKVARYKEGRKNIYAWAVEKYSDYEKYNEERQSLSLPPLKPHLAVVEYKKIIDDYETWESEGMPLTGVDVAKKDDRVKVYACPECSKEFSNKEDFFSHLVSHQKESNGVNNSATDNKGKGKG